MISFESDYIAGAHPKVLEKLLKTNLETLSGYGTDIYCNCAKQKIKNSLGREDVDIYFLLGGTQANSVVISSMLNDFEGVIAADTGHISAHEAGAIEYTGHKVLPLPNYNGKISSSDLSNFLLNFYSDENHEHMVFPGMVYISHPTEYGTLYSKEELIDISKICKEYSIPLYMDGARLSYALTSNQTDVTLKDIANICDAFYIGGTKCGALCGEAVVFSKESTPKHFFTSVKQHGALLAKGRLLGVQFDTLFSDDLYFEIGRHAIKMAEKLRDIFIEKGYSLFLQSPTNQQFVVLDNNKMNQLKEKVTFSFWEKIDENHTVVRFATSWSTTDDDIKKLREIL